MKITARWLARSLGVLALIAGTAARLSSCSPAQSRPQATIKIDGSSTVYPITNAIAAEFQATQANKQQADPVNVTVDVSGTSGGFRKFCEGVTDISNASRPILQEEMAVCRRSNVGYIELPIAFDALTVAVNPQNNWAKDITVAELKKIWEPAAQGKITKWNQVRASWPNRPLKLFGAGKDSGTFDYFTEATVGQARASRNDYTSSVQLDKGEVGTVFGGKAELNVTIEELLRKQATY